MPTSFKFIGIGLLLTLVGFFLVQQDLRLKIWGKKIAADVMHQDENTSRRSREVTSYGLTYRFIDEKNEAVIGGGTVPLDYQGATMWLNKETGASEIQTVNVVYLPGKSSINRLATESAFKSYLLFFGGIVLVLMGGYVFKNESVVDAHRQTAEDIEAASQPPDPRKLIRKVLRTGRDL